MSSILGWVSTVVRNKACVVLPALISTVGNRLQGQSERSVQQLLKSPELAQAVHQMVSPYAKAVPALALTSKEVGVALSKAADALHFVKACHTTVNFRATRAVIAPKAPSMQASSPVSFRLSFLAESKLSDLRHAPPIY